LKAGGQLRRSWCDQEHSFEFDIQSMIGNRDIILGWEDFNQMVFLGKRCIGHLRDLIG
jgi:hypothetical protein